MPRCLPYYYDHNGDQQVINTVDTFSYTNKSGKVISRHAINDIRDDLEKVRILVQCGIPIEIYSPIMDNELRRLKTMNTTENHQKAQHFQAQVRELMPSIVSELYGSKAPIVQLPSSIDFFGDIEATPAMINLRKFVTHPTQLGITVGNAVFSQKTLDQTISDRYDGIASDVNRSAYCRSREFATITRLSDIAGAAVHSSLMAKEMYRRNASGLFAYIPKGAEIDAYMYNLTSECVIFQS